MSDDDGKIEFPTHPPYGGVSSAGGSGGYGGKYFREYDPYTGGYLGKTTYYVGAGGVGVSMAGGGGGGGGTLEHQISELRKTVERQNQQAHQYRRLITNLQTKIDVFADVIENLYDMMHAEEINEKKKFEEDWVQKHVIDRHAGLLRATGYLK